MKETLIVPSPKISRKVTKVRDFCLIFCLLSFASPAFEFLCLLLFRVAFSSVLKLHNEDD